MDLFCLSVLSLTLGNVLCVCVFDARYCVLEINELKSLDDVILRQNLVLLLAGSLAKRSSNS